MFFLHCETDLKAGCVYSRYFLAYASPTPTRRHEDAPNEPLGGKRFLCMCFGGIFSTWIWGLFGAFENINSATDNEAKATNRVEDWWRGLMNAVK